MSDFELLYKLLVIGNSGVGKTSLLMRYVEDKFASGLLNTVGVDFKTKIVTCNNQKIKLQIWDTAGHERFRTITGAFYRGAMGILLVYDITDDSSFAETRIWLDNIKEKCAPEDDPVVFLVGNKMDLETSRLVDSKNGQAVAKTYGISFAETSAATNTNVESTFELLVEEISKREKLSMSTTLVGMPSDEETHTLDQGAQQSQPSSKSCCRK